MVETPYPVFFGVLFILFCLAVYALHLLRKNILKKQMEENCKMMNQLEGTISRFESSMRNEFRISRDEENSNSRQDRIEILNSFFSFENSLSKGMVDVYSMQKSQLEVFAQQIDKMGIAVNERIKDLMESNNSELEKMRKIVEEKLQETLEVRLSNSFKIVSDSLEQVQKGLGEMQTLASGVGDLKKVLTNVKTKGILGEYQLSNILENVLPPSQYASNVVTKEGSSFRVEFAVKIPSKTDDSRYIYLPIDAKLPTDDYYLLAEAYENADPVRIAEHKKNLEQKIKRFAKDISEKYIDPPNTTDFAVMFLPFEGLYAEVLRIDGLFELIQRQYRVVITGPATLAAFLNSLYMGFRTLALEKRSGEVWELLGRVKKDFNTFGELLEKTQKKLDEASSAINQAGRTSRSIEKKLEDVQLLPE